MDDPTTSPPTPRQRVLNALTLPGLVIGIGWAIAQFIYNSAAVSETKAALLECEVQASEAALSGVTIAVCLAALLALAFVLGRRPALALSMIGVEALLVIAWFAMEGGRAAGCAIE